MFKKPLDYLQKITARRAESRPKNLPKTLTDRRSELDADLAVRLDVQIPGEQINWNVEWAVCMRTIIMRLHARTHSDACLLGHTLSATNEREVNNSVWRHTMFFGWIQTRRSLHRCDSIPSKMKRIEDRVTDWNISLSFMWASVELVSQTRIFIYQYLTLPVGQVVVFALSPVLVSFYPESRAQRRNPSYSSHQLTCTIASQNDKIGIATLRVAIPILSLVIRPNIQLALLTVVGPYNEN